MVVLQTHFLFFFFFLQLIEEVLASRSFGKIDQIYLSRGHIFVILNQGRKLVTFDTKPADHIQVQF